LFENGPIQFLAQGAYEVTNPGFIFVCLFSVVVYFYGCMFAFSVSFSFSVFLSRDLLGRTSPK